MVMSRALVLSSARAALLKLKPVRFMLSNPYLCMSRVYCRLSFIMLQEEDISLWVTVAGSMLGLGSWSKTELS